MIPDQIVNKTLDELISTTTRQRKDSDELLLRHASLMIIFVSAPKIFISIVVLSRSSKFTKKRFIAQWATKRLITIYFN